MADKLTEDEIETRLNRTDGWQREGDTIVRKLTFPSFMEAIAFIDRIAELADEADHHPEIFNVYDRVTLTLTTHDAGGLTNRDFDLADAINGVI